MQSTTLERAGRLTKDCALYAVLIICLLCTFGLASHVQAQDAETDPLEREFVAQAPNTGAANDYSVVHESAQSATLLKTTHQSQIDFLLTRIHLLGTQQEKQKIDSDTNTPQADNSKRNSTDSNNGSLKPKSAKTTLIQTTYSAPTDYVDDQPTQHPAAVRKTITAPSTIGAAKFTAARSRASSLFPVLTSERSVRARR